MMNKRKNTSRSAGQGNNTNTTNRSSPRSRGPLAEGVYNNSHFLHAAASQVGNNVRVKTKGGVVVEGIFRTFSENFHIALEVPHRYQNGAEEKKINVDTVQDNLIIKLCDIVTIEAKDVDLEYATRDTFQTDTAIASRLNVPFRHGEKELEPWMDGPDSINGGDMNVTLELDVKSNGWDANEMFSLNEKEHGIKTTFKDNLESYTVQIERKDTTDFRKQELEAERIANEIENNPTTKERLDLENGDEETVFAAVVRPEDQNSTNSNMINNNINTNNSNNEKMTPPPSSQNKYIPKQQRNQGKMMPGSKMYSKPMQQTGPPQQQQPVQQTVINGGGGFKMITINPPHQFNQPPPSHYVTQQQQQQQNQQSQQIQHNQQVLNNNSEANKMNNNDGREMVGRENSNSNNSNKSMPSRGNMRIMNPPPQIPASFSEPPPQLNQVTQQQGSNQHMGKPINMHIPPPQYQAVQVPQDGSQPTAVHVIPQPVVVVAHPQQIGIHAAPQPQRPQRDPMMRSRNDDIRSLRQFHNDFQMAPPSTAQVPPQQSSQAIQTMPPSQQQRPEMQDNGQMVHIPQQPVPQNSSVQQTNIDSSQQPPPHMKSSQHVNSSSSNNNNNSNNASINHVTHHPTPSSTPHLEKSHGPSTPPQANTPQQQNVNSSNNIISNNSSSSSGIGTGSNSNSSDVSSSGNDKGTLGTKKYTLNPQAKPFTPRNPSTPNQSSRPHTPQTPMAQAPQQPIPPPQQSVVYAPSASLLYIVPSNQRPTAPATLARKTQFHQFQVTQATGQPIFNPPAPPQAVMPYHPSQMQTVQSQTYPQAIRMYPHEISAQQQPHLTSYLVPTPPSTTPSPGQPHQQTFHPGPQPSAGPPAQAFQPPGSYVMLMPSNAPPFVYNQHNPQSFQIVSSAMPQQQHPTQ